MGMISFFVLFAVMHYHVSFHKCFWYQFFILLHSLQTRFVPFYHLQNLIPFFFLTFNIRFFCKFGTFKHSEQYGITRNCPVFQE